MARINFIELPAQNLRAAKSFYTYVFGWSLTASLQARLAPNYMGSKTYTVGPGGSVGLFGSLLAL